MRRKSNAYVEVSWKKFCHCNSNSNLFQSPVMARNKTTKALKWLGTFDDTDETWDELSDTPSAFTLNVSESFSVGRRLKGIKPVLEEEIKVLEREGVSYEGDEEELVQALDLLTWLEFQFGSRQKAMDLNSKALALTNNQNAFTLGNRAHLLWREGEWDQARSCLTKLKQETNPKLKTSQAHHLAAIQARQAHHLAAIQARQAYCYLRLGGPANLPQSAELYEKALEIKPNNHLWRLQAGRVYKRLAHPNFLPTGEPLDRKLKADREKRAKEYFQYVADYSPNPKLRAFAYSDLASMASLIEGNKLMTPSKPCNNALSLDSKSTYVLLNCGKSLSRTDTPRALRLLTKASELGPSSHIFFELAKCLERMACKEKKTPQRAEQYRDEAEQSFQNAIRLAPTNFPARFSFGKLLWGRGKVEEARKEFMQIFTTVRTHKISNFAQTLMMAYEQAALCQLELCKDQDFVQNLPESVTESSLKCDAETMLIKALGVGSHLLNRKEIQIYLRNSLESLLLISQREKNTTDALLLISRIYCLAKNKEKSLEALDKLWSQVQDDPEMVALILNSYVEHKDYEKAYTLLQLSIVRLGSATLDEGLYKKVVLSTARGRLLENSGQTARVFKGLFDHCRQQRCVQETEHPEGAAQQPSPRSGTEEDPDGDDVLDVLIFYDESADGSEDESSLENVCRELQEAMCTVLGLNVSLNLQVGF